MRSDMTTGEVKARCKEISDACRNQLMVHVIEIKSQANELEANGGNELIIHNLRAAANNICSVYDCVVGCFEKGMEDLCNES